MVFILVACDFLQIGLRKGALLLVSIKHTIAKPPFHSYPNFRFINFLFNDWTLQPNKWTDIFVHMPTLLA